MQPVPRSVDELVRAIEGGWTPKFVCFWGHTPTREGAARFEIVVRGSFAKFEQNDGVREFLVRTGEKVLVEASPTDQVWGVGLAAADRRVEDPRAWLGLNLLGFALMVARGRLTG